MATSRRKWDTDHVALPITALEPRSLTPSNAGTRPGTTPRPVADPAERERGFNTYLSGANEERVRDQLRRQKEAAGAAAAGPGGAAALSAAGGEDSEGRKRRQWSHSPSVKAGQVPIRADDGRVIFATPRTSTYGAPAPQQPAPTASRRAVPLDEPSFPPPPPATAQGGGELGPTRTLIAGSTQELFSGPDAALEAHAPGPYGGASDALYPWAAAASGSVADASQYDSREGSRGSRGPEMNYEEDDDVVYASQTGSFATGVIIMAPVPQGSSPQWDRYGGPGLGRTESLTAAAAPALHIQNLAATLETAVSLPVGASRPASPHGPAPLAPPVMAAPQPAADQASQARASTHSQARSSQAPAPAPPPTTETPRKAASLAPALAPAHSVPSAPPSVHAPSPSPTAAAALTPSASQPQAPMRRTSSSPPPALRPSSMAGSRVSDNASDDDVEDEVGGVTTAVADDRHGAGASTSGQLARVRLLSTKTTGASPAPNPVPLRASGLVRTGTLNTTASTSSAATRRPPAGTNIIFGASLGGASTSAPRPPAGPLGSNPLSRASSIGPINSAPQQVSSGAPSRGASPSPAPALGTQPGSAAANRGGQASGAVPDMAELMAALERENAAAALASASGSRAGAGTLSAALPAPSSPPVEPSGLNSRPASRAGSRAPSPPLVDPNSGLGESPSLGRAAGDRDPLTAATPSNVNPLVRARSRGVSPAPGGKTPLSAAGSRRQSDADGLLQPSPLLQAFSPMAPRRLSSGAPALEATNSGNDRGSPLAEPLSNAAQRASPPLAPSTRTAPGPGPASLTRTSLGPAPAAAATPRPDPLSPPRPTAPDADVDGHVTIRVLSTWNGTNDFGLTEIELYDESGKKVALPRGSIAARGLTRALTAAQRETLDRLLDDECRTTDPMHMWFARAAPDDTVDFLLRVPDGLRPSSLGLWNYNKSFLESSKGVKEVEVHWEGQVIFRGVMPRGAGNPIDISHALRIPMSDKASQKGAPMSDKAGPAPLGVIRESAEGGSLTSTARLDSTAMSDRSAADSDASRPSVSRGALETSAASVGPSSATYEDPSTSAAAANRSVMDAIRGLASTRLDRKQGPPILTSPTRDQQPAARRSDAAASQSASGPIPSSSAAATAASVRERIVSGRRAGMVKDQGEAADPAAIVDSIPGPKPGRRAGVSSSTSAAADSAPLWPPAASTSDLDKDKENATWGTASLPPHGQAPSAKAAAATSTLRGAPLDSEPPPPALHDPLASLDPSNADAIGDPAGPRFGRRRRLNQSTEESLRSLANFQRHNLGRLEATAEEDPEGGAAAMDAAAFIHGHLSALAALGQTNASHDPDEDSVRVDASIALAEDSLTALLAPARRAAGPSLTSAEGPIAAAAFASSSGAIGVPGPTEGADDGDAAAAEGLASQEETADASSVRAGEGGRDFEADTAEASGQGSFFSKMVDGALSVLDGTTSTTAAAADDTTFAGPSGEAKAAEALEARRWTKTAGPSYSELFGNEPFVIPERPCGAILEIVIYSTWGDVNYVGLNGLEVFDSMGRLLNVTDPFEQVSAEPDSVNVLPGMADDPRTPDKLVDGINMTCDDLHCWLTPFTPGNRHVISIDFGETFELGCLRLWNLNKSRVHASRGARLIEAVLDGTVVFRGDVARAPGTMEEAPLAAENILFTVEEEALAAVDEYDERYRQALRGLALEPPSMLQPQGQPAQPSEGQVLSDTAAQAGPGSEERPMTAARPQPAPPLVISALRTPAPFVPPGRESQPGDSAGRLSRRTSEGSAAGAAVLPPPPPPSIAPASLVVFEILESWGDQWYVGLTGIELLSPEGHVIDVEEAVAEPSDVNMLSGGGGASGIPQDPRTPDKVICGVNQTTDDTCMWLAPTTGWFGKQGVQRQRSGHGAGAVVVPPPFVDPDNNFLALRLSAPSAVASVRVYNYNKSQEDSQRGVKRCRVYLDGVLCSPVEGFLLRPGPGHARYDFGQALALRPDGLVREAPLPWDTHELSRAWLANLIGSDPKAYSALLDRSAQDSEARQELRRIQPGYDVPQLPTGFTLQLVVRSTWGDRHYVGLAGLEVHDALLGPLPRSALRIHASPFCSVRELPGMDKDCRTPEKLLDGVNTGDLRHSWLAPIDRAAAAHATTGSIAIPWAAGAGAEFERGAVSVITIVADRPFMLSAIRVWNYGPKAADRGIRDLEIYLDSRVVFSGTIARVGSDMLPGQSLTAYTQIDPVGPRPRAQAVLFSCAPEHLRPLAEEVMIATSAAHLDDEQPVLCLDESGSDERDHMPGGRGLGGGSGNMSSSSAAASGKSLTLGMGLGTMAMGYGGTGADRLGALRQAGLESSAGSMVSTVAANTLGPRPTTAAIVDHH